VVQIAAQREGVADMTANKGAEGMEGFHRSLLECVEDIGELLPGLSRRYEMPVIIDAMAEHVGSAIQVLLRKKLCDAQQADQIIRQLEGAALASSAQAKTEEEPEAPPTGPSDPENSTPE
jgi:hypothetical protein